MTILLALAPMPWPVLPWVLNVMDGSIDLSLDGVRPVHLDVLGLGSEAPMNLPGTSRGNWRWQFQAGALTTEFAARLRELTEAYDR